MVKKNTLLYLDDNLVRIAKESGLNLSEVSESAIRKEVMPFLSSRQKILANFENHLNEMESIGECFFLPFEVKRVYLKNVGPINEFSSKIGKFNFIIGQNASGKTTILRKIAYFAGYVSVRDRINPASLNNEESEINIKIKPVHRFQTKITNGEWPKGMCELNDCRCVLLDDFASRLDKKGIKKFINYLKKLNKQVIIAIKEEDLDKFEHDKSFKVIRLKQTKKSASGRLEKIGGFG